MVKNKKNKNKIFKTPFNKNVKKSYLNIILTKVKQKMAIKANVEINLYLKSL